MLRTVYEIGNGVNYSAHSHACDTATWRDSVCGCVGAWVRGVVLSSGKETNKKTHENSK